MKEKSGVTLNDIGGQEKDSEPGANALHESRR
jgi:hypothetical protein